MAFFDERISPRKALVGILFSTVLVFGLSIMGWLHYLHVKELRAHDAQYRIVAIVQASPDKEMLQTGYLAELLELSVDKPTNLYQLDRDAAEKALLRSPLIKQGMIKKILPGTLYIDYRIRTPTAYLGDYANTAVDSEGVLIPFTPFFTPKRLPMLYIGLEGMEKPWGRVVDDERLKLAFSVMKDAQACCLSQGILLKQIDVTNAYTENYGQKQLVVVLEEEEARGLKPVIIARLNPDNWQQNFDQLFALRSQLSDSWKGLTTVTVDLRIPHLAFIKKE